MLLPQAVQFIGDEFALVEDDERFAVQYGEEGHGGREERESKIARLLFGFDGGDDVCHPARRLRTLGAAGFLLHGGKDALLFALFVKSVRRRTDVDAVEDGIALRRHFVVGFDRFHLVAEKVDADGVFEVDGPDVEDVAAEGEAPLGFHVVLAAVPQRDERSKESGKVGLSPRRERDDGKAGGHELQDRFDVADEHFRARLPFVEGVQAGKERIFGESAAVSEHFVLCGKERAAFARERGDALFRALCGEGVRRHIDDAAGRERADEILLRVRKAVASRGHAVFDVPAQKRVLAAQLFKREKSLHPLYLVMTRSTSSPEARASAASAALWHAAENSS